MPLLKISDEFECHWPCFLKSLWMQFSRRILKLIPQVCLLGGRGVALPFASIFLLGLRSGFFHLNKRKSGVRSILQNLAHHLKMTNLNAAVLQLSMLLWYSLFQHLPSCTQFNILQQGCSLRPRIALISRQVWCRYTGFWLNLGFNFSSSSSIRPWVVWLQSISVNY